MSAFHPGGLAIIKKAMLAANVGRTVTLVSSTNDSVICIPDTVMAVDNPLELKCWIVEGDLAALDYFGLSYSLTAGVIPEEWLMPIDGYVPSKEELREQELVT